MRWEKITAIRTALLILAGAVLITFGVFLIYRPAGFIAGGVALFVIEYLTTPAPDPARR